MLKNILIISLFLITIGSQAQQLAFPGAVGFGRFAVGGRGGTVVHVTNLDDSGPGSLRDAISQPNRMVVFDVAGIININSRLVFSKNLTIAGQTAPGEGVVVYGNGVSFSGADNIICRYMRFRMGLGGDSGKDAAGIANGQNMIFDHVSVSWGRDETFSISWDNKGIQPANITIQNSIISQGLQTHSAGGLIQTSGGVSLYRNLYVDNHTRNPKVKGLNQFVNNVVYNWGGGGCYILGDSEGTSWATIVNNYFIEGPESGASTYSRANENFQLFAEGNYADANRDGTLNGKLSVKADYGPAFWVSDPQYWATVPAADPNKIPQMHPEIPDLMTAEESYYWVVDSVGCILPVRDQVDQFVVSELTSLGTKGKTISSELENPTNGPGVIYGGPKLKDTDNDGMPDVWEDANSTNKTVNDAAIIGIDGYSNIEKYIHSIHQPTAYLKYPTSIGATAISTSTITLTWTNNEPSADSILINYGTDNTFSDSMTVNGQSAMAVVEGLKSNTEYFFRLKTVSGDLESSWTNVYKQTTSSDVIPPVACVNPKPANDSKLTTNKNVQLSWENHTGVMAGVLYYDVYLGKSESSMVVVASQTTASNYMATLLDENTTYFWRVKTSNLLGSNDGDVWSFTTGSTIARVSVLYFPFNETSGTTATDFTNSIVATANNFAPNWMAGKKGNAIYFPGTPTNSYVKVSNFEALTLNTEPFTISLWFKSVGGVPDSYLLLKGMHDHTNNGTGKWVGIQYKGTTLTFGIDDDSNKTTIDVSGANKWFNNEWHLLVCVRDVATSQLRLYVDGVKIAEKADGTGGIGSTGDLIIGNRNGYFDNPFPGSLDELKIFNAALSATEINDLYLETTTAINSVSTNKFKFQIYPNPFTDCFTINLEQTELKKAKLQIFNPSGMLVYETNIDGRSSATINGMGQLPGGIYYCILSTNNLKSVQKLIKK